MYDIALILWRSLMYHESYSYLTKGLELLNKESSDDIELQLSYYETAGKLPSDLPITKKQLLTISRQSRQSKIQDKIFPKGLPRYMTN